MRRERQLISSGSPYEPVFGYSRAVRVGDTVYVAGTVAWGDDGKVSGAGDIYAQARQAIRNIEKALAQAGASLRDVVLTRTFITDMSRFEEVARAHGEAFGEVRPAATLVEVSALVEPEMLVEMEAIAVISEPAADGVE
jgi:enamine deaminase RidA (YjgF/YER057c/UK114 family)